jgi:hypothetical protein
MPSFPVPNSITRGHGFYVSYNTVDTSIYGSDTTALVVGQMEHFYILIGDHRDALARLVDQGVDACLSYFSSHPEQHHHHCDRVPLQR